MKLAVLLIMMGPLMYCSEDNPGSSFDYDDDPADTVKAGELIWSDEFNGTGAPNSNNWTYDLGDHGWGNNEVQDYTRRQENVRVENGILIIEALKEDGQWTSARIKTQGLQNFTHVTVKARAKLPNGSGTWPAIWMLGSNFEEVGWPASGEIDIMEHVGKDPGLVHSALHTPSSHGNTVNTGEIEVPDFNEEFHVYEVNWTAKSISFKVDGEQFYSYEPAQKNDNTWPYNHPFFLIVNIAMGGNWGSDEQYESGGLENGIDPSLERARMEVDYIRVYKN